MVKHLAEQLVELARGTGDLTTNERGRVTFTHRFSAARRDGLFTSSGYVVTNRTWLRVSASGYRTTFMPLDRQSGRGRDLHDETPICVTVPIGRR